MERGRELYLTKVLIRDALFENLEARFFQYFKSEMLGKFSLIVFERLNILYSKDFRYAHLELDKDEMVQLWKEVQKYI